MSRIIVLSLGLMLSLSAFAQNLDGFNNRFSLVRNADGKVTSIKLKKLVSKFSIMPFIEQIKNDLLSDQSTFMALSEADKEAHIDSMLMDIGIDPYSKDNAEESAK